MKANQMDKTVTDGSRQSETPRIIFQQSMITSKLDTVAASNDITRRKRDHKESWKRSEKQTSILSKQTVRVEKIDKKLQRVHKTKKQRQQLWSCFKKNDGKQPPRDEILELAKTLKLAETQIYKWFWDTQKKV